MLQRAADGVGRHAAQGAQGTVDHGIAQVLEQREIRLSLHAGDDAVDYLHAPHGPDAARGALAARLVGAELHGEASLRRHVDGVVEQDRKSTRLNFSHVKISYAVFCLKKKKNEINNSTAD